MQDFRGGPGFDEFGGEGPVCGGKRLHFEAGARAVSYGCWVVGCDSCIGGSEHPWRLAQWRWRVLGGAAERRVGAEEGLRVEPGVAVGVY